MHQVIRNKALIYLFNVEEPVITSISLTKTTINLGSNFMDNLLNITPYHKLK